ncbi:MAG: hypothetical protein LBS74_00850 [Oscillospiraceae bacterium]|jgi:predicted transposase/invertase (TIGR01784 family)|nr:hypothetical protein [Oscillospiraceae bacterium]
MTDQTNNAIGQAYAFLRELSEDEAVRLRNESYLKAKRDEWSRVAGAREEGLEEGLQKGRAEGREELIRLMSQNGVTPEDISSLTGIPLSQVEDILKAT